MFLLSLISHTFSLTHSLYSTLLFNGSILLLQTNIFEYISFYTRTYLIVHTLNILHNSFLILQAWCLAQQLVLCLELQSTWKGLNESMCFWITYSHIIAIWECLPIQIYSFQQFICHLEAYYIVEKFFKISKNN